jgi:hypothetical protein
LAISRLGDSEEDRLSALANNLKAPITAHGLTLKQHLVQTLVPTARQVKSTHAALENKVDVPFEAGLLEFNDACRTMENAALREEEDLKVAYAKIQVGFSLCGDNPMLYAFSGRTISRNYSHSSRRHIQGAIKSMPNSTKLWNTAVAHFF